MRGKQVAAKSQYLLLDLESVSGGARLSLKHNVSSNQSASYGTLFRADECHSNSGMLMDHRFNFFRMNLIPSNVDGSIPPSNKEITIITQLHHVARINIAVGTSNALGMLPDIADCISP